MNKQYFHECIEQEVLGNGATMYSGSSIISAVTMSDNVTIGANALLLNDAQEGGIYVGCPAYRVVRKEQ